MDEFRTSMLCSRCGAILRQSLVRNKKKGGGGSYSKPFQLRRFTSCRSWWQRDVNAAAAMAKLANAELRSRGRGKHSRGFKCLERKGKGQSQAVKERCKEQKKRLHQQRRLNKQQRRQARRQQ